MLVVPAGGMVPAWIVLPEGCATIVLLAASQTAGRLAKFTTAPGSISMVCSTTTSVKLDPRDSSESAVSVQLKETMSAERTRSLAIPESLPGSESLASKGPVPVRMALPPRPSGSPARARSSAQVG